MSFDSAPIPPYNASDPHARFLASSALDLLLIELVPLSHRLASEFSSHSQPSPSSTSSPPSNQISSQTTKDSQGATASSTTAGATAADDAEEEQREAVFYRLEGLGYRVGLGLVERFSRERARFEDPLDVIKFLCKDLWTIVWRKQIDNLKTNHRGVYVLTDNAFRPFGKMSMANSAEALQKAQPYLYFPCGLVRGALASMGINATVQAECQELPIATFQIKTVAPRT